MTRILILWEDKYCQKLDLCLRRILHSLPNASGQPIEITRFGVQGNGGFEPFVRTTWHTAAGKGILKSNGPIDELICIADADRAASVCTIEPPPAFPLTTDTWIGRANQSWTAKLRACATFASDRVHGLFLRWSLESLLIALHDVEPVLKKFDCRDREGLTKYLASCDPHPNEIAAKDFVERFRAPAKCLDKMLDAAGAPHTRKGSVPREDALEIGSREALDRLKARVPDLVLAAEFVQKIAAR